MATTISLDEETRDRLKKLGAKGESYDDIVKDLIDRYVRDRSQESRENSGNGAEGYRKRTDRSKELEKEMNQVSTEADRHLDSQ